MLIQSQNTGGGDMHCRLTDLRKKEVINVKDGARLGTVCDAELDARDLQQSSFTAGCVFWALWAGTTILSFAGPISALSVTIRYWSIIRSSIGPGENGGFFLYFSGMDETA